MSRLDDLLEELCPSGVKYKSIGEIATDIYRGTGIKREQVTETGIPCVRYGEIYTTYGVWFESCVSHTNLDGINKPKYFEHGDILFAITGESVEDIAKCTAYIGNDRCLAGGDIVVLKHEQDPKYLSYALSTSNARFQKGRGKVKSKVVHSSVPAIKELIVPIPPLEVQHEIVRILDSFNSFSTELSDALNEELLARRKQYEYYLDKVLSFDEAIPRYTLREIVDFRNGKGHEKNISSVGKYVVVNSKFISTNGQVRKFSNEQICPLFVDDILMVMSDLPNGRALAKCFLVDKNDEYTLNQRIGAFHVKDDRVITKFLFYILNRNRQLLRYDNGVDQTNLKKDDILDIKIPLPSIDIQKSIVDRIDDFTAIISDIERGLSNEAEARQTQYEYYRDKLLDMKNNEVG